MYRDVDLSSHNIGRFPEHEDDKFRPERWTHMDDFDRPENLLSRQKPFLRTIDEHTGYASYVRSLSWTLIWTDDNYVDSLTEIDYRLLWDVFSRMQRVETLDLAQIPSPDMHTEKYTREIPPILFPHVMDLRLVGWMTHSLVINILNSIDLSKLRALRLLALQEEGRDSDGGIVDEDINKKHWNDEERARRCEDRMKGVMQAETGIVYPGPMWIPFLPLIGKLTSLQYLEICIPPLEDSMEGECPDHKAYISTMTSLLESVSPTLEKLDIEYARGEALDSRFFRHYFSQRIHTAESMLGSFFASLGTEKRKWKNLEQLSLKGFLHEKQLVRDPPEMSNRYYRGLWHGPPDLQYMRSIRAIQDRIEVFLNGKGCCFEWLDEAPRPALLYMGYM